VAAGAWPKGSQIFRHWRGEVWWCWATIATLRRIRIEAGADAAGR
jgi:hypothetical protein